MASGLRGLTLGFVAVSLRCVSEGAKTSILRSLPKMCHFGLFVAPTQQACRKCNKQTRQGPAGGASGSNAAADAIHVHETKINNDVVFRSGRG